MNKPLTTAFCLFISGILFARYVTTPLLVIAFFVCIFFLLSLSLRKKRNITFYTITAMLIFLLGVASYVNYNYIPLSHISGLLKDKPRQYYIQGVISSDPEYYWSRWGRRATSFILTAYRYKDNDLWLKSNGISKVVIENSFRGYSYGDILILSGSIKAPSKATNPGQFDYAEYLKAKRIYTVINVTSDDDVIITRTRPNSFLKRAIFNIRRYIERLIDSYLKAKDAAILKAMLVGKRSTISGELNDYFVKTGTAHILSVSGLHVSIISAIIFYIFSLMRVPRRIRSMLVIAFLFIYTILTSARAPIIRSSVMITIYLLGYLLERDFDIYSALSLAGLLILLVNPMQLFDAGFLLSFSCIFSITYLTPRLQCLLNLTGINTKQNIFTDYTVKTALASLAVFIGVWPIVAHYFNIISPVTILANIFIIPLSALILALGVLFVSIGSLTHLAAVLAHSLHILFSVLIKIMVYFSEIPFAYIYIPNIPFYIIGGYYFLLLSLTAQRALRPGSNRIFIITLFITTIFLWKGIFWDRDFSYADKLKITFLDTSRGSASVFIESDDGRSLLINAGKRNGFYIDNGKDIVSPFIWHRGRRTIDILLLTDLIPAHTGATLSVLERIDVDYFLSPKMHHNDRYYKSLKDIILKKKIKIADIEKAVQIKDFGKVWISIVSEGSSILIKLKYREAELLIFPQAAYLYYKDKPELAILYNDGTRGKREEIEDKGIKLFSIKESGAITLVIGKSGYLLEHFLNTTYSNRTIF